MNKKGSPLQVAILLYPGVTALDAAGPWEVLSRIPNAEIRFVGKEEGPVVTEGGALLLGITHTTAETTSPDLVLVPGGITTPGQMVDDAVLDWLRKVHQTTRWTASVCTGALILGAAGILKGSFATTHWYKMGVLRIMGAKPQPDERIVRSGKIVTAAGVSAGIDLALWLAGEIAGREQAEAIQLIIEYDPHPPFDAGHMRKASKQVQSLARQMMDDSIPADQRSAHPKDRLEALHRSNPHRKIGYTSSYQGLEFHVRCGSFASFRPCTDHFRLYPRNRHSQPAALYQKCQ